MSHSHFRRGQSTFKCSSCGHMTRNTGVQSVGSEVCPDCWELAGIYNAFQDGEDVGTEYGPTIIAYCAAITAKGGTLDSDNLKLLELAKAAQAAA